MRDLIGVTHAARDEEELTVRADGQGWIVSWHPPTTSPAGTPHGASGVCITDCGDVVLISNDGREWGLPGGRTEDNETWEETLQREMLEEACATVVRSKLLGFGRSRCVEGHEAGLIIVRSMWRADVVLAPWEPRFEIPHRRVVPMDEVRGIMSLSNENGLDRILLRVLDEAGIPA